MNYELTYSNHGMAFTESFEDCKLVAYQDQAGVWTIGWGHTAGVSEGDTCTQEMAYAWLIEDMAPVIAAVNTCEVDLNQMQFDALVDFGFNLGVEALLGSTLWRLVNARDFNGAEAQFPRWCHAGGLVSAGLLRRRKAEDAEFSDTAGDGLA